MKVMDMPVNLIRIDGEEPQCPKCGHHNAMLHNWRASSDSDAEQFTCRDCGHTQAFTVVKPVTFYRSE